VAADRARHRRVASGADRSKGVAIVTEADRRFPIRIAIKVPPASLGARYNRMMAWLDEHCGVGGWAITPAGTLDLVNDAMAIYVDTPSCALAFATRWLIPGDPSGFYQVRDEPPRRASAPAPRTP
jgi:hypothetical protein